MGFFKAAGLVLLGLGVCVGLCAKPLAHWLVRRRDRALSVESGYLHGIIDASLVAFAAFCATIPFSLFRQSGSPDCWHAVRITATRAADCGSCVQVAVNMARADRVSGELIQAVLEGRALPAEVADAVAFTEQILVHHDAPLDLRERLQRRYGPRGMTELAYAIASSQVFPYLKQTLGHSVRCAKVGVT